MYSPLPKHPKQLLLPMNPEQFQKELGTYTTVGLYVGELLDSYDHQDLPALKSLHLMATLTRLPEADAQPLKMPINEQFFYIGEVIGLRVMELEKGVDFASKLFDGEDVIPVDGAGIKLLPSRDQKMHAVSHAIMNASDSGYLLAEPYHETVEHISRKLCPAIEDQPYVRRGFGLTMFMTAQSILRNLELEMTADVERAKSADWDRGWGELGEGA
jgi:hypothetical protein